VILQDVEAIFADAGHVVVEDKLVHDALQRRQVPAAAAPELDFPGGQRFLAQAVAVGRAELWLGGQRLVPVTLGETARNAAPPGRRHSRRHPSRVTTFVPVWKSWPATTISSPLRASGRAGPVEEGAAGQGEQAEDQGGLADLNGGDGHRGGLKASGTTTPAQSRMSGITPGNRGGAHGPQWAGLESPGKARWGQRAPPLTARPALRLRASTRW